MSEFRFSPDEMQVLRAVLDEIIPAAVGGELPGAGEAGLAEYIEQAVRETPEIANVIRPALAALDQLARERTGQGFGALAGPQRRPVIAEFSSQDVAFFLTMMFHAYSGYYQHERVVEGLGLEARPPHPKGYVVQPSDLDGLLQAVRQRPKLYRDA